MGRFEGLDIKAESYAVDKMYRCTTWDCSDLNKLEATFRSIREILNFGKIR